MVWRCHPSLVSGRAAVACFPCSSWKWYCCDAWVVSCSVLLAISAFPVDPFLLAFGSVDTEKTNTMRPTPHPGHQIQSIPIGDVSDLNTDTVGNVFGRGQLFNFGLRNNARFWTRFRDRSIHCFFTGHFFRRLRSHRTTLQCYQTPDTQQDKPCLLQQRYLHSFNTPVHQRERQQHPQVRATQHTPSIPACPRSQAVLAQLSDNGTKQSRKTKTGQGKGLGGKGVKREEGGITSCVVCPVPQNP